MCPDCGKPKMQFESERKANDFIKWNADDFVQGRESLRAYYCKACCCWHISHKHHSIGYGNQFSHKMESYRQQRGNSGTRLDRLIRSTELEPVIKLAEEIYSQLNFTSSEKGSMRATLNEFFSHHKEYEDTPVLRVEINHLYLADRKRKRKKL